MKKLIVGILLAAMAISLFGCTAGGGETTGAANTTGGQLKNGVFSVGYSRVDISPVEPVPVYSGRIGTGVLETLFTTCTAVTDEKGTTVLLISMDLQRTSDIYAVDARRMISEATGVPQENIYISASHTHVGVFVDSTSYDAVIRYIVRLKQQMVQAAKEAMADRKPAEMYYGSVETENMNFVRHYKYTDSDGAVKYFGSNFGTATINSTTTHATEVDTTMHLIHFKREGASDVVLTNWRAHPTLTGGSSDRGSSSDWVGSFRRSLELLMDCKFQFFQGAGGNVNSSSRIESENRTTDYNEYGAILANYAMDGLENMKKAENTVIQTMQTVMDAKVYHGTDHLYQYAVGLTGDSFSSNDYGIRSKYHASHIVDRYNRGESEKLELNAVAIGNAVAFVTAPDELFDTNAAYMEENSPYAMNFTLTLCNGHMGYLPSEVAWEYTCYESDVSTFEPGTAEQVQEHFLKMLKQMSGKQ